MKENPPTITRRVRTLFLSDIHLGARACQAERLLSFLREYECEFLYLVGDIIDLWSLKRGFYWPNSHNTVVQKVLRMARHGTQVFFVPGNHDEALRHYAGFSFGAVEIVSDHIHVTAAGQSLWITHGDQYDQVTRCHRWVSVMGDVAYSMLVNVNRMLSLSRRKLGIGGHWSLADYAKRNVLKAVAYIGDFEKVTAHAAAKQDLDGVVCGHIHTPAMKVLDGIHYFNCGDWVDSCTALVEHRDGQLELVRSTPEQKIEVAVSLMPVAANEERLRA